MNKLKRISTTNIKLHQKNSKTMITKGPISQFIETHYLHFNAAALVDAAKGYEAQLHSGSKCLFLLQVL